MVSNRLPVALESDEHGGWRARPASGGLVAVLDPIMAKCGGVWVGWPGVTHADSTDICNALDALDNDEAAYRLSPVTLSEDEHRGFYEGFSNEIIWPLFHNRFTACNFDPDHWRAYQQVNAKFAQRVSDEVRDGDFIWVHDYHLINLAHEISALGIRNRCGFFLHIPFPTLGIIATLPWWREMLHALLAYDFIGVQTDADRHNLLACIKALFTGVEIAVNGDVADLRIDDDSLDTARQRLRISVLPIGIDWQTIEGAATNREISVFLRAYRKSWSAAQLALGVDRLDYTKGLPEKLKAFRNALHRYPELRSNISLDQHVIPSREQMPEYQRLKNEIDRLVGEINGEFTAPGWIPIHYYFGHMTRSELMAYYRVADIALVTPLKDGMNLVAKEYCAAKINETGVLILSEFAGCAEELGDHALLVNPHDVEQTADAIYAAYRMSEVERAMRMRTMRIIVHDNDAFGWVRRFMELACANTTACREEGTVTP